MKKPWKELSSTISLGRFTVERNHCNSISYFFFLAVELKHSIPKYKVLFNTTATTNQQQKLNLKTLSLVACDS
jgi:hypothetical protein